ncbi:hypothetical protein TNCV_1955021 [Trichonephila clavipes]|nr:hypothetical protein TNCV_1955021 [Trichonephila clavipes]
MSLWLYPTGNIGYCGAENISRRHYKNREVFFSVMSRDFPDKVILVEPSSGESGDHFPPSYETKIDIFGVKGIFAWNGIMLGSRNPVRLRYGYCQLTVL